MQGKGFYASFEAAVSLAVLAAIVVSIQPNPSPSLEELLILQKENDLLRVWAKQGIPAIGEMEKDFLLVFPEKAGIIELNGEKVFVGEAKEEMESVSSEIVFLVSETERRSVTVSVFK